eukprot:3184380-Pyramimonas_sp.AAC.1
MEPLSNLRASARLPIVWALESHALPCVLNALLLVAWAAVHPAPPHVDVLAEVADNVKLGPEGTAPSNGINSPGIGPLRGHPI